MERLDVAPIMLCIALSAGCTPELDATGTEPLPHDGGALDASTLRDAGPSMDAAMDARVTDSGGDSAILDAGPINPCDLRGRWLIVKREVGAALGGNQIIHRWMYYELEGAGERFSVTKGLVCGDGAAGAGVVTVATNFEAARLGTMQHTDFTGRTLTGAPTDGGCKVTMEKWYTMQGATVPYYLDPKTILPTAAQQATATTPGWEDWDSDGNPGVTGDIDGTFAGLRFTGQVFVAPRRWDAIDDTVPDVSRSFVANDSWGLEQNVMSATGAGLLGTTQVTPATDAVHIAEFVRLSPEQALGDDVAICTAIRALAPTLAPSGSAPP